MKKEPTHCLKRHGWGTYPTTVCSLLRHVVYCNPQALGRDLAHIIVTISLSDMYVWPLTSTPPLCLIHLGLWSVQVPAIIPLICKGQQHTHGIVEGLGTSSVEDILIGKPVPLGCYWTRFRQ